MTAAEQGARPQIGPGTLAVGHHPERDEVQAEVDDDRDHVAGTLMPAPRPELTAPDAKLETTNRRPSDTSSITPCNSDLNPAVAILARHRPHGVHRVLGGVRDPQAAYSAVNTPMISATIEPGDRAEIDQVAERRKVLGDRVLDRVLLAGVVMQHEPEDGREYEQQREQREEP